MCELVDRSNHIPVDLYGTDQYPIAPEDIIFKNIKNNIILPISEFFHVGDSPEYRQLDYFAMGSKRGYNSDSIRDHICQYLNYFEKFYDTDKILLMAIYNIKLTIDMNRNYKVDEFIDDINRYIIRDRNLGYKISHFVADNYTMRLSSNNGKTPNLQFCNYHAKLLYEISLMMNIYIPLASHYYHIHMLKKVESIQNFMLRLFDACIIKYEEENKVGLYDKLYEMNLSVTNKSKNADKILWAKNAIRGKNTTLHVNESIEDIILQMMPKYTFDNNIINFGYFGARQNLRHKITAISYELSFVKLSSSKRDEDQNSEFDKYEARLNKKDEALSLQNKVAAEAVYKHIEQLYGPFDDDEVEHYRKRLIQNNMPIINTLQFELLGYMYYKYLGDPITWKSVPNTTAYIKLMIAAKRILIKNNMTILPYILGGKVVRTSTRKMMSKKDQIEMHNSELFSQFVMKYNNPQMQQEYEELVGKVESSSFEIIDWDGANHCPSPLDGRQVPMINSIISEEMLMYAINI